MDNSVASGESQEEPTERKYTSMKNLNIFYL